MPVDLSCVARISDSPLQERPGATPPFFRGRVGFFGSFSRAGFRPLRPSRGNIAPSGPAPATACRLTLRHAPAVDRPPGTHATYFAPLRSCRRSNSMVVPNGLGRGGATIRDSDEGVYARITGGDVGRYFLRCGDCRLVLLTEANRRSWALAVARSAGWRHTRKLGWLCHKCKSYRTFAQSTKPSERR